MIDEAVAPASEPAMNRRPGVFLRKQNEKERHLKLTIVSIRNKTERNSTDVNGSGYLDFTRLGAVQIRTVFLLVTRNLSRSRIFIG